MQALSNDAAFVRVRKGVYALRALAGNIGPVPHNTPKSSRPPLAQGLDHRDSYRYLHTSSHEAAYHMTLARLNASGMVAVWFSRTILLLR